MKFTKKEVELIEFLYEYAVLNSERNEIEMREALSLLDLEEKNTDSFIEMFENSLSYHGDDRLTLEEEKTIQRIHKKIDRKQTLDYLNWNLEYDKKQLEQENDLSYQRHE